MVKPINQAYDTSGRKEVKATLDIVYYTDPLCCWSWAMREQLDRFKTTWQGSIQWRYCMGGVLPAWNQYVDSLNSVCRPAQMGPVWMQASQLLGIPMPHRIWVDNPPASSYPACVAVKCAMLQSPVLGELYFQYVQEAIMVQSLNIAQYEILKLVAERVAASAASFDLNRFYADMKNGNGLEAFRKDVQEVKYRSIQRFPALLIRRVNQQPILIMGYKPADTLIDIIARY